MSLATRCPACSTVFRVVQDQLKVSGGWVRCGHCHEVFNGLEALFELPPEPAAAPPEPPPTPAPSAPPAPAAPAPAPNAAAAPDVAPAAEPDFDLDLSEPEPDDAAPGPASAADAPVAKPEPGHDDPPPALSEPAPTAEPPRPPAPASPVSPAPETQSPLPEPTRPEQAPTPPAPPPVATPSDDASGDTTAAPPSPAPATTAAPSPEPVAEALPDPAAEPAAADDSLAGPDTATQVSATAFAAWQAAAEAPAADEPPIEDELAAAPAEPAGLNDAWPPRKQRRSRKRRTPKPSFVRQAEQAALWRRPAMRALLGFTALALGALLALQVLHQERDQIAARWPALQPGLQRWCEWARCSLQPPRALASLTLDSSALGRTARSQVLRFEADLRNAAEHVVRAPALELSFTDNQGRPLARKVLLPEDLAAPSDGIPADGVWHIDARLDTGDFRIASFTAEIFYP